MTSKNNQTVPLAGSKGIHDRRTFLLALGILALGASGCAPRAPGETAIESVRPPTPTPTIPAASDERQAPGADALFSAIELRRSIRSFTGEAVSDEDIMRMLWAAQGITAPARGFRASPSAGALYPLETYVATSQGVRHYVPRTHTLETVLDSDVRGRLAVAALGQRFVAEAPVVFVITAVYARTEARYGDRAARYVHMEVGHAGQNISLMAVHLGLGSVIVGAFIDEDVRRTIGAPAEESPLYIIPVGTPG